MLVHLVFNKVSLKQACENATTGDPIALIFDGSTAEIENNDLENSLQDRAVKIITAGENDSLYKLIFNKDSITKSYY